MQNIYRIKMVLFVLLFLTVIGGIIFNIQSNRKLAEKNTVPVDTNTTIPTNEPTAETRNLCYYRSTKTSRGFYDKALLKLSITGEKVTGEFQNLPAESDSKVGLFEGKMEALDQKSMSRSATVWWESRAEGMEVKEELSIKWGDGSATAGFGEMIDRGNGVYVYKDKTSLYYIDQMDQKDCDSLDEQIFTEKYIKDNISKIATNKAVLGGSWYVISVNVNSSLKTGEATYEDGHLQSKATFSYQYNKEGQEILINNFKIVN